jgi:hypothetical protein
LLRLPQTVLRGESRPRSFDHAHAALARNLSRFIRRFGIHYQNFIRPRHRFARLSNMCGFIKGDNGGCDFQNGECMTTLESNGRGHNLETIQILDEGRAIRAPVE